MEENILTHIRLAHKDSSQLDTDGSHRLDAHLGDLTLHKHTFSCKIPGQQLADFFDENHDAPGVIVLSDDCQHPAIVTRREFFELIGRPFGRELYLNRPLEMLMQSVTSPILSLTEDTSVIKTVSQALSRVRDSSFEAIIVCHRDGSFSLVTFYEVLLVYSELHAIAMDRLNHLNEKLKIANTKLSQLSLTDGLTRIGNRRRFDEVLEDAWNSHLRFKKNLSVIMCDVDHFKKYNDTYGHQMGDYTLRSVADALQASVRRATDGVYRYGGEEFVIVLQDADVEDAIIVAQTAMAKVGSLYIPHEGSEFNVVTFSMGIAVLTPASNMLPQGIVELADQALYCAKKNGRNRYEIHQGV